jgi:glycyl-tRNA synthetase
MDFQNIVMKLNEFWSKQGCCIVAADDTEKGAGTFSHHTFLRSLGPEPCQIAHIDPSRRPKDGRYGENPNRLQLFHQYQVLLKPAPETIIQLYLDSLEAIGLSQKDHDIRFVQDDWESPTLGAWGLGWEVWCDGMEITQFTYFQSVAGIEMESIPVEIAYGLERLSMFINHKSSIYDVPFGGVYSYKDLYHLREVQASRYNLEEASSDLWFNLFEVYSKEVVRLIEKNLPIPAYDFVNKASHAFNMLDARGFISVTERQSYILKVRELAAMTAKEYLELRKKMGFPLLKHQKQTPSSHRFSDVVHHSTATHEDFLLEVFTEDLPAHYVPSLSKELEKLMGEFFVSVKATHAGLESYSTHRRLALIVRELKTTTEAIETVKKGPSVVALFTPSNTPTPVAQAFFSSIGKNIPSIETLQSGEDSTLWIDGGYVFHKKTLPAQDIATLLQQEIPKILLKLKTPKSMRWNSSNIPFARPVRGLICLYGDKNIPIEFAEVHSQKITWGHRQRMHKPIAIGHVGEYLQKLEEHYVILDPSKRKERILGALPQGTTGIERLIDELIYLSEYPEVGFVKFDPNFLTLPPQLIELEMIVHQRYLPIYKHNKITNEACVILDAPTKEHILENNGRVLRARLSDGAFFFEEDKKLGLKKMTEKLDKVVFQKELGTYKNKIDRMVKIAESFRTHIGKEFSHVIEAIEYCKGDLNSNVVGEFPELQGLMGSLYAKLLMVSPATSSAICEHYQPQMESDPLPSCETGKIVSLIDKLDNIIAFSTVNLLATSSKDPYAQRRQALSIVKLLKELGWDLNIDATISHLLFSYNETPHKEKNRHEPAHLIRSRLKTLLLEAGYTKEEVEALIAASELNIVKIFKTAEELKKLRQDPLAFKEWLEVYRRVKGQAVDHKRLVEPDHFVTPQEKELFSLLKTLPHEPLLAELLDLKPKIDALFDHVHINDPDIALKENRQQMLWTSSQLFEKRLNPAPLLGLL